MPCAIFEEAGIVAKRISQEIVNLNIAPSRLSTVIQLMKFSVIISLIIIPLSLMNCAGSSKEKRMLHESLKKFDALSYMSSKEMDSYVKPFNAPSWRFEMAKEIKNPGLRAMLLTSKNPGFLGIRLAPILFFIDQPEIVQEIGVIDSLEIAMFTFNGPDYQVKNGQGEPFKARGEGFSLTLYFEKLNDPVVVEWETKFPNSITDTFVPVNPGTFDELQLLRAVYAKLSPTLLKELAANDKNRFVRQTASQVRKNQLE
jgi:hypothetical protein